MTSSGRVVFSRMDEVIFGMPAAKAVAELARRAEARRVFLMASGTLERETGEIGLVREALGNTCAAVFNRMPPHTPRKSVIEAVEMARDARADLIVTVGGGSAKAVSPRRRWRHPGCRAIRVPSADPRRCGRFWSWLPDPRLYPRLSPRQACRRFVTVRGGAPSTPCGGDRGKGVDADLRRHDEGKRRPPGAIFTPMDLRLPCRQPMG
nr:iron-containing alcohol dehydrogenase [uncultured Rhodopila sp.]